MIDLSGVAPRKATQKFDGEACERCAGTVRYVSSQECVACAIARGKKQKNRKTYPVNKITHRRAQLKKRYGLTIESFNALLLAQGGCCAICKRTEPTRNGYQNWHVDHDHATNTVRGVLCAGCNRGLGFFEDSPAALVAAAEYLNSETQSARVFFAREFAWLEGLHQ